MKYPLIVKWSITDKCNLNCKHCFRTEKTMSISETQAQMVINDLSENHVACVALTGGEPLAAPNFFYILRELSKRKIQTEIATNGTLLDIVTLEYMKKYGVKTVQVSLEGPTAESNDYIRGKGTFEKVIHNIRLLKSMHIGVTVAVTLTHLNFNLIEEFIQLKSEHDIDALRFELYIPVRKDTHSLALRPDDIHAISAYAKKYLSDPTVIFPQLSCNHSCGAGTHMAMINSDLTLSPCDLLCDEIRSSEKISDEFGIRHIWNTDSAFENWRKTPTKGCGASLLKYNTSSDILEEVYQNGKNT